MSAIKVDWAKVDGVKADFVKGEVKITLRLSLETGLDIRGELVELAEQDQPVIVEIKPWQSKLPMLDVPPGIDSVTLSSPGHGSVTLGKNHGGSQER